MGITSIGLIEESGPVIGASDCVLSVKVIGFGRVLRIRRVSTGGRFSIPCSSNASSSFLQAVVLELPAALNHSKHSQTVPMRSDLDRLG